MKTLLLGFRDLLVSLKLTVFLLALSIVLIFWATLTQADLGVWGVQQKFFHSFFVLGHLPGTDVPVPLFPGGYFIGGLLLLNLISAQFYRLRLNWRKAGIWLTHLGLILLLVGELVSGLKQKDYQASLPTGQPQNFAESDRENELAVIDATGAAADAVTAIPESLLADGETVQTPALPFRVVPKAYFPNTSLSRRQPGSDPSPSLATAGVGPMIALVPLPTTARDDERNLPAAYIELVGAQGSLGTYLVSSGLPMPQHFSYEGRDWKLVMRPTRHYFPFAMTLLKFSHDIYPGTDIPKNFSSRVRLDYPTGESREVLIYMNNPLRTDGLTFYQASFTKDERTTILQVVHNPSWTVPYIACLLVAAGLVVQFYLSLATFTRRQAARWAARAGGTAAA